MKPLDQLTPEQLDLEACEAVGIEPKWRFAWRWPGQAAWTPTAIRTELDCRDEYRAHKKMFPDCPRKNRWPVYPPVSTDPASCARLKQAASEVCGWPFVMQLDVNLYCAWVQQDLPAVEQDGPYPSDDGEIVDLSVGVAVAGLAETADTEERAVALAVAAWARSRNSSPAEVQ